MFLGICSIYFHHLLTLREEHGLMMIENKFLRIIFGPRIEVTWGWRKLHNEELCNFYSTNITTVIKSRMRGAEQVACMEEMRNTHKILARRPQGKWLLGGPRHREGDDIRIGLRETGCEGWIKFNCLIRANGKLLWTWQWNFNFHKSRDFLQQININCSMKALRHGFH
jgi:hypothetical protein